LRKFHRRCDVWTSDCSLIAVICHIFGVFLNHGNVVGAHQPFFNPQRAIVTNRHDTPCNRLIRICIWLSRLLQCFDFAKPGLNGVILICFNVSPVRTIIC
jgi:hypothetical protein